MCIGRGDFTPSGLEQSQGLLDAAENVGPPLLPER